MGVDLISYSNAMINPLKVTKEKIVMPTHLPASSSIIHQPKSSVSRSMSSKKEGNPEDI